jgi:hypothetical protein
MNERLVKKYLEFLVEMGHKTTHSLMGINPLEFEVLSDTYSDKEIISELSTSKNGLYLFTDNSEFVIRAQNLLLPFIKNELEIYSDLFSSNIKISSLSIDNQYFTIMMKIRMSSILNLL